MFVCGRRSISLSICDYRFRLETRLPADGNSALRELVDFEGVADRAIFSRTLPAIAGSSSTLTSLVWWLLVQSLWACRRGNKVRLSHCRFLSSKPTFIWQRLSV